VRQLPIYRQTGGCTFRPNTLEFVVIAYSFVDDQDFDRAIAWRWSLHKGYAVRKEWRNGKCVQIYLHNEVTRWAGKVCKSGETVDHANRNRLDNQRHNLEPKTKSEQEINKALSKDSTSGMKGVSWHKKAQKWQAHICFQRTRRYLGIFDTKEGASAAYEQAVQARQQTIDEMKKMT
jgi:hypothetical protein